MICVVCKYRVKESKEYGVCAAIDCGCVGVVCVCYCWVQLYVYVGGKCVSCG